MIKSWQLNETILNVSIDENKRKCDNYNFISKELSLFFYMLFVRNAVESKVNYACGGHEPQLNLNERLHYMQVK